MAFFWTSGADGVLRLLRCNACGFFNHPPGPVCRRCLSRDLAPQELSGRGRVETFTVNYQQWIPGSDPYIIAWVSIDEQPDIRLTTNLVGVEPQDVRVGLPVRVVFEHVDDVWLPLFTPADAADVAGAADATARRTGGRFMSLRPGEEPLERRAVISGIGQSAVGRRLGRSDLDLTVEAALEAIADAGLTRDDIDGISTYPGMGAGTPGFGGPTTPDVQDALGLSLNWHDGGGEGPAQMRAVMAAALGGGGGPGPPRPRLPHRQRGFGPGDGGPPGHRGRLGAAVVPPASAVSCSGRSPSAPRRPPTGWPWWRSGACTSSG